MERLSAYSSRGPNGSTVVDVEGMAVDLITVMKAGGITRENFMSLLNETWDQCEVTIDTSGARKDS